MATQAQFADKPNCHVATIAAANAARDGSGTLVDFFIAAATNSLYVRSTVNSAQLAAAASSARVICFYVTDNVGANPTKIGEVVLPAGTPTIAVVAPSIPFIPAEPMFLESGQKIVGHMTVYAGVQDKTHVVSQGGNY